MQNGYHIPVWPPFPGAKMCAILQIRVEQSKVEEVKLGP